ncbi:MAG: hypothetical protein FWC27_10145 [Firmicutes bacterium]|nr:hypothetical protein [Bacillota bacterium]
MKHLKKFLVFALAFILVLGISAPAMAEDSFRIITEQQQQTLLFGSNIALSVEVHLPEGWTLEYRWYGKDVGTLATEATLLLSPGAPGYPQANKPYEPVDSWYVCEMTVRDKQGNISPGSVGDYFVHFVAVTIEPERGMNTWEKIKGFFVKLGSFFEQIFLWVFFWPILLLYI